MCDLQVSSHASSAKPKIVFIIPGLNVGGAEHHTLELRAQLNDMGFPTFLIVHGRKRSATMIKHRGAAGALYLDLKGMSDIRGWFTTWAVLRRQSPNIIVAINQMPLIVSVVSRALIGLQTRVVSIFHTTMLQGIEKRQFPLYRWALRYTDCLIFVSENQERYWRQRNLYCLRCSVIRNGVDFNRFKPDETMRMEMRSALGFRQGDIIIGLVAAFRPEKNHVALIKAVRDLRETGLRVSAVLVGDGPTRSMVAALVMKLGLGSSVIFVGEQADVRPYIACSDIGVLCSVSEAMPLSALEFLAMGVPMVISDVGGASEIVEAGRNGWLVDPTKPDDLTEKLVIACRSYNRMPVDRAINFSVQAMSGQYAKLFCEVVQ